MTDEREPLWSDIRIRDRYHALVPCEANMGEMEYWNVLRDVGERVSYELRNDYEARIAELETQVAGKEALIVQLVEIDMPAMEDANERLEAQLAQTWQPVGHFKRACTCRDCRNLYGMENESLLTIQAGNNISNILSVVLPDNIRLCRLVERAEVQPYSHRNGETEPPMKEGWYAMQHPQAWNWQGSTFVFVERNMDGIDVYCAGQDDPIGYDQMDNRIRWYGPIVPPWEVDHE